MWHVAILYYGTWRLFVVMHSRGVLDNDQVLGRPPIYEKVLTDSHTTEEGKVWPQNRETLSSTVGSEHCIFFPPSEHIFNMGHIGDHHHHHLHSRRHRRHHHGH